MRLEHFNTFLDGPGKDMIVREGSAIGTYHPRVHIPTMWGTDSDDVGH